ncbi:MAG TPA: HPr family phosphocarrier protein [Deltaproteobacteria bacterium]|nr:HPr family phosphocarrier protein [Deltaproteobacteria bacterium]
MNRLFKNVVIINDLGLHARAAAMVSKIVQNAAAGVWMMKDGERIDAASVLDILTLAGSKGSKIRIEIEDPSDSDILDELASLIENGFGE